MDTISYSAFRANLATTLDRVNDNHKPIMITRQNGKPAVVISLEDFQAYEETAHLMDSPKNAERLNQAIAEVEVGRMTALEAMSDLYRTLPEAAGQDWLQDSRATDLADDIFEKNDD